MPKVVATLSDRQKALLGLRPWYAYGRIGGAGHDSSGGTPGTLIVQGDAIANGGVGELTTVRSEQQQQEQQDDDDDDDSSQPQSTLRRPPAAREMEEEAAAAA
eukprot:COSAG01_NODE_33701_length_560_cov_0.913232_1_plen_102_part_10